MLQSMVSQRVGHNLVTEQQHLHIFLGCPASESPSYIWKIHLTVNVSETLVPFTTLESPKVQIPSPAHSSCFVTWASWIRCSTRPWSGTVFTKKRDWCGAVSGGQGKELLASTLTRLFLEIFLGPDFPHHSLFHTYSLSLLLSAFSLILLEARYLSFVVTFVISLAWNSFCGL